MSVDIYYDNKKAIFENIFGKDADENVSEFLQYVAIEMNRELTGEISDLKSSIKDLTDSNYETKK